MVQTPVWFGLVQFLTSDKLNQILWPLSSAMKCELCSSHKTIVEDQQNVFKNVNSICVMYTIGVTMGASIFHQHNLVFWNVWYIIDISTDILSLQLHLLGLCPWVNTCNYILWYKPYLGEGTDFRSPKYLYNSNSKILTCNSKIYISTIVLSKEVFF